MEPAGVGRVPAPDTDVPDREGRTPRERDCRAHGRPPEESSPVHETFVYSWNAGNCYCTISPE